MASLLTLFPFEEPQYKPVKEGEKGKNPTHAQYMRTTYGYASAGLTCGQCKHFSQDTVETKQECIDAEGNVSKVWVERGGCFHCKGGRVQSWKPGAAGCRLWEGK